MKKFNKYGSFNFFTRMALASIGSIILFASMSMSNLKHNQPTVINNTIRERISINEGWRFFKYDSIADNLIYDVRPEVRGYRDDRPADSRPTEVEGVEVTQKVLKPWILPSGNDFIKDTDKRYVRPDGNPGSNFPFVQSDFDDSSWKIVNLPHDWAIEGPFITGQDAEVGGSMGRLPSPGVAWYRKKFEISESDAGKSIFLDIDGAMSYAMVWLNGNLVGGWIIRPVRRDGIQAEGFTVMSG